MTDMARKPLRLWPGIAAIVLLLVSRFGVKIARPDFHGFFIGMMAAFACALLVVLWWLAFSRAVWVERLGGIVLIVAALFATMKLGHVSMWPAALLGYVMPTLLLAFVAWAVATRYLPDGRRRLAMVATVAIVSGAWLLVRTEGVDGDHDNSFMWRWTKTAEERLLAGSGDAWTVPGRLPLDTGPSWPGFRGSARDGVVRGVRIATDWSESPPVELWRRPVGPGWSSVAVVGDRVYTQEQRGEHEVVTCYSAATGAPIWIHEDLARFYEVQAGAGPRATPTVHDGRVYTFGGTGILNALDALDGSRLWSRDVASDAERGLPQFGFASSPLIVNDLVIVDGGRLAAYDRVTGEPRWFGPKSNVSHSSPHLVTSDGVPQIVLLRGGGVTSVSPADGEVLWKHSWEGFAIAQPALTANGDVLIGANRYGTRRLTIVRGAEGWSAEERWTSIGLKPYFNDFVVHLGSVYGFDGRILANLDADTGERRWKGGRYGHGQLLLLADQDLLLVLSEKGELALVSATPDKFKELARFPAIEGKTWNHPVLVDDLLLVRNGSEMAAFRLAREGG